MTAITRDIATKAEDVAESRVCRAAQHLFEAEVALHAAHQSRVDAWIAAAGDKLHEAIVEHLAAIAEQRWPRRAVRDSGQSRKAAPIDLRVARPRRVTSADSTCGAGQ